MPGTPDVMWLDPGVTTGWAMLIGGDFMSGEDRELLAIGHQVGQFCLAAGKDGLIGWERFTITPYTYRMRGSETALEVIGVARYLGNEFGLTVLSTASRDARKLAQASVLRKLGWYAPGKGHANDAASHLASWVLRSPVEAGDELHDHVAQALVTE